ncbi:MAG: hypothetical protein ABJJ82_18530, partial [Marinobacter sp.]
MARLKQKEWMTLKQAAQYLKDVADEASITELDLIQYAIEGNLVLSLHCFSYTLPAMPGRLVPPSEGAVTLCRTSEVVQFCDVETRQVLNTGNTHHLRNVDLPSNIQDAARAILLGRELTADNQSALDEINKLFPDKLQGDWSFDFVGTRFPWLRSEVIFEPSEPETIISNTWDIASFGHGKFMLEMTWQRAQDNLEENITSLEAFLDGTLYLIHKDGVHCAEVHDAARAISD